MGSSAVDVEKMGELASLALKAAQGGEGPGSSPISFGQACAKAMGEASPIERHEEYLGAPRWFGDEYDTRAEKSLETIEACVATWPLGARVEFARGWAREAPGLGSTGLSGCMLARALLRDDPKELAALTEAGCDLWALSVGGWLPMDWAWREGARRCAPIVAAYCWREELAEAAYVERWRRGMPTRMGMPFNSAMPFMSSPTVHEDLMKGFEKASRAEVLGKLWQRDQDGVAAPSPGAFVGKMALRGRLEAKTVDHAQAASLEEGDQAMAWWLAATPDSAQLAWLESIAIGPSARMAPGAAAPRL